MPHSYDAASAMSLHALALALSSDRLCDLVPSAALRSLTLSPGLETLHAQGLWFRYDSPAIEAMAPGHGPRYLDAALASMLRCCAPTPRSSDAALLRRRAPPTPRSDTALATTPGPPSPRRARSLLVLALFSLLTSPIVCLLPSRSLCAAKAAPYLKIPLLHPSFTSRTS
jgi:hypothetical protein